MENYSETDTRAKFIDPQLYASGWEELHITREYYFTDGRKLLAGKRGKQCFVDYLLTHKNLKVAVVEAKRYQEDATKGLQQAIDYAIKLGIDHVYSTNGREIYEFIISQGRGDFVDVYPSPDELYQRLVPAQALTTEKLLSVPFHTTGGMRPRYYQERAVNSVLEAIAAQQDRILLTLATGTGKTYIAFQIVWKLLQSKWNIDETDRRPSILFLADRNVLADQAINTFNPLEKDLLKINGEEIRQRNGRVPTNAFIFFAIYQAIAEREDIGGYYREYPPDFFDLIIIDECHRGSANEEGSWRDILDYFGKAVHLGLTATPKRQDNVDTYAYFGSPVYEYSLKEGINDGFLTPYKVKRIKTNIDEYIFTSADTIVQGEVQKPFYTMTDFNRNIVLPDRTDLIAQTILQQIRPLDKTIIFCVDQSHALLMRDMINKYKRNKDPYYCVRITSDEGQNGRDLLEKFQDNDRDLPVILTSSQMLTTGVDARNVRNIVLVRTINSMVEFKQIIGRGTRVFEGKDFFTILDFTGASELFYDEEWEGPPEAQEEVIVTGSTETGTIISPPSPREEGVIYDPPPPPYPGKTIIKLSNGRKLKVIDVDTRYIDEDGRPLSTQEFLEKLVGTLPALFPDEATLRRIWAKPETRKELLHQLEGMGFDWESLEALQEMLEAPDTDIFDVLAHLTFSTQMISREKRAVQVKENETFFKVFRKLEARTFLEFVLDRYTATGVQELDRERLGELIQISNLGTASEAVKAFGDANKMVDAFYRLQEALYQAS